MEVVGRQMAGVGGGRGDMPGGGPRVPHAGLTLSVDVGEAAGKAGLQPGTLDL